MLYERKKLRRRMNSSRVIDGALSYMRTPSGVGEPIYRVYDVSFGPRYSGFSRSREKMPYKIVNRVAAHVKSHLDHRTYHETRRKDRFGY